MFKLTKTFFETMYHSSRVVFRTVRVTISEEVELSRARAKARYDSQHAAITQREDCCATPSLSESLQILGVEDVKDEEGIKQRYAQLFEANDRSKGGSFYLQSKVVRAKQRIDREFANMMAKVMEEAKRAKISDAKNIKDGHDKKDGGEKKGEAARRESNIRDRAKKN